jgi:nitroimidazol reductase NimA-like FMN-containing flavoprotein (pyridoxamine 5'-phosphate oxidase superfamily)
MANSVAPALTGQFRELPEAECLELLKTKQLGRVAYHDQGPVVLPVKYVLDEDTVLFRTSPHSSLAQHMRATHAAFQVDEIDDETDAGWSVLIRGRATYVDCSDLPEVADRAPPWHEGVQSLHVRITPRVISGRRLGNR